jgi:hypothetical protein
MVHSGRASAFARGIGVWKVVTAWWLIPSLSCHRSACAFQTGKPVVALLGQEGRYRSFLCPPKSGRPTRPLLNVVARILPNNNGYGPAARSHLIRPRSISLESTSHDVSYFDETWGHLLDYEVRHADGIQNPYSLVCTWSLLRRSLLWPSHGIFEMFHVYF